MMKNITATAKNLMSHAGLVCAAIMAVSVLSLASALIAEHVFGLKPCTLCLLQRVPYVLTALLGLIGLLFFWRLNKPKAAALAVFLSALIFLTGSVIAFYHTGVEQHWWVSVLEGCKISFDNGNLLAQIEAAQAVRCDEIPWADPLFNISMAGYNAMMSFGLFVGGLIGSILITRKANGF